MIAALDPHFAGYLLDGLTAATRPATVAVKGSGLEIVTEDGRVRRWPFTALRQTQGFRRGEPIRFEHGGVAVETLIVHDRAILRVMTARGGRRGSRFAGVGVVVAAGGLTLALAVAAVVWGIPAGSAVLARWVPAVLEERFGRQAMASLPAGSVCHDAEGERVIRGLVERLTGAPGGIEPPTVAIVDTPIANAFALPGRRIVVFRGLLELTDSPEMLAAVLAHEMAHLVRGHPMQGVLRRAALSFAVATLTGGAVSGSVATTLAALHYIREMEEEADRDAVAMLQAARIDPVELARFLDRVSATATHAVEASGALRYLSTHPPTPTRTALVRELAARTVLPSEKLLPGYAWEGMRDVCLPR